MRGPATLFHHLHSLTHRFCPLILPQGGPHNHQIAALAVALREAQQPSFTTYIRSVKANAKALAASLVGRGYEIVTGGTDNHLVLWDLRPLKLTGSKLEKMAEVRGVARS